MQTFRYESTIYFTYNQYIKMVSCVIIGVNQSAPNYS
jgi:hypothetical protein